MATAPGPAQPILSPSPHTESIYPLLWWPSWPLGLIGLLQAKAGAAGTLVCGTSASQLRTAGEGSPPGSPETGWGPSLATRARDPVSHTLGLDAQRGAPRLVLWPQCHWRCTGRGVGIPHAHTPAAPDGAPTPQLQHRGTITSLNTEQRRGFCPGLRRAGWGDQATSGRPRAGPRRRSWSLPARERQPKPFCLLRTWIPK